MVGSAESIVLRLVRITSIVQLFHQKRLLRVLTLRLLCSNILLATSWHRWFTITIFLRSDSILSVMSIISTSICFIIVPYDFQVIVVIDAPYVLNILLSKVMLLFI